MKAKQWPPWPVIGHDWAVEFLQRALAHGRSRHAYLFIGTAGLGKRQLALAFVMAQNCEAGDAARPCQQCRSCQLIASERSPDIIFTRTSGNNETILIEEIRRVSTFFALHPYEMRHRIAILDNFERAAPNAQDALLKTLEEPPSYASLILLAREEGSILPTILSRCQQLRLRPSPPAKLAEQLITHCGSPPERASLLAQISGGRPGWAIRALRDPTLLAARDDALDTLAACLSQSRAERFVLAEHLAKDKSAFAEILDWWLSYWRDITLLSRDGEWSPTHHDRISKLRFLAANLSWREIQRATSATRTLSERLSLNLNLRLAIEVLLLAYPRAPRYHTAVA